MCGVVGMYTGASTIDSELQLFKNLLLVDQIRGMHATGVIKVKTQTNDVAIHKKALDAVDFLALKETKDFLEKDRGNIYIGHNRYATMGDKANDANAHPFQQDHITMVHNGGVSSWGMDLLEGYRDPNVVVDSHMVCMTIAKHGIKKAVEEHLDGAFTLIWWDSKERSLNFIRNEQRPLFMAVLNNGTLVWASEKGMLDVFCDRESRKSPNYRIKPDELEAGVHLKFLFSEKGLLINAKPEEDKLVWLDLPIPKRANVMGNWDYYGTDYPYYGSQNHSSRNVNGNVQQRNNASASNGNVTSYGASNEDRNRGRVDTLLKDRGLPFRYKSIVTLVVKEVKPYAVAAGTVELLCEERESKHEVSVWGVSAKLVEGVEIIRAQVSNAYPVMRGGKEQLTVTCTEPKISCFDSKYDGRKDQSLDILSEGKQQASTSRGSTVNAAHVGTPIRYPLKTNGHTFQDSTEFVDFVCCGCSLCGKIPTPYDRRNTKMSVVAKNGFTGLLSECEFICGECEGV